jgi:hypothetical protein
VKYSYGFDHFFDDEDDEPSPFSRYFITNLFLSNCGAISQQASLPNGNFWLDHGLCRNWSWASLVLNLGPPAQSFFDSRSLRLSGCKPQRSGHSSSRTVKGIVLIIGIVSLIGKRSAFDLLG